MINAVINGVSVSLRDDLKVKENEALMRQYRRLDSNSDWKQRADVLRHAVIAWGFPGDPQDLDAWGNLDEFELLEIQAALEREGQFTVKQRFPAKDFGDIKQYLRQLAADIPWTKRAELLGRFVESWEFPGAPTDIASWGELNMFVMTAIENALGQVIMERAERAKNLATRSITV